MNLVLGINKAKPLAGWIATSPSGDHAAGSAWLGQPAGWQRAVEARPSHQRLLIISAGIALVLVAADALWPTSAIERAQAAPARPPLAEPDRPGRQTDLQALDQPLQAPSASPGKPPLAAADDAAAGAVRPPRTTEDMLVSPAEMVTLVEQVLDRHGQVQVRSMRPLERIDLLTGAGAAGPGSTARGAAAPGGASLYRHGLELQLEGSFGDLLACVQALEAIPRPLTWGPVAMQAQQPAPLRLTLRVHTISRERHGLAR